MEEVKTEEVKPPTIPPPATMRQLDVTQEHFHQLKALEEKGSFKTNEHPNIVNHYFRGLALRFTERVNQFDRTFRKDAFRWNVELDAGARILVTKLKPRFREKVSVRVEQEFVVPTYKRCPYCGKQPSVQSNFGYKVFTVHYRDVDHIGLPVPCDGSLMEVKNTEMS